MTTRRRWPRIAGALLAAITGWIAVMAVVMLVSDAAPAAVVLFPSSDFLSNVPEGTAVISRSAVSLTVKGEAAGFGPALYKAGAVLVLPAGLTGCLPLPRTPPDQRRP